jgi:hypothetical protein
MDIDDSRCRAGGYRNRDSGEPEAEHTLWTDPDTYCYGNGHGNRHGQPDGDSDGHARRTHANGNRYSYGHGHGDTMRFLYQHHPRWRVRGRWNSEHDLE